MIKKICNRVGRISEENSISATILIILILAILIPFILEHFIFRNEVYSVLDNKDWSSFLGSFLGGIIGGVGTLIAVLITIKQTKKIQTNTDNQIEIDRDRRNTELKVQFANGIAENVAEYITDISLYFSNLLYIESKSFHISAVKSEISFYEDKIKELIDESQFFDTFTTLDRINSYKSEQENYSFELERLKYELEKVENDINNHKPNRTKAVNIYFLLDMKLRNIPEGQKILEIIKDIHNMPPVSEIPTVNWLGDKVELLTNEVSRFVEEYPK